MEQKHNNISLWEQNLSRQNRLEQNPRTQHNQPIKRTLSINIANALMRYASTHYLSLSPTARTLLPEPKCAKVRDKSYLLYIHIPFCLTLCTYCSFNRFLFNESKARAYFIALREEIMRVKELGYDFSAIYVGGGTTLIMPDELIKTLTLAKRLFSIRKISCESDPNHIDIHTLQSLKGLVDRLSIGVQSFNDDILRKIGRFEKFGSGAAIYERLSNALGILPMINVDLIFNFPLQSPAMLQEDLDLIKSLKPEQVTTYPLMSSPLVVSGIQKAFGVVDLDNEAKLYGQILDNLCTDFTPLSSWAFSYKGAKMFDEYVVDNDEYVGVGSGSFSFLDGTLYVNSFSLKDYGSKIAQGAMGLARERRYAQMAQLRYRLIVELFGGCVSEKRFKEKYGVSLKARLWKELTFLRLSGNITYQNGAFYPTRQGRYCFLSMMKAFYIGMDSVREQSRAMLKEEDM